MEELGTTERVHTLLGLLRQRPVWTGAELADRLGVTPRTVRHDVARLRTLGYPVHAGQGIGGGYQLGPGQERFRPRAARDAATNVQEGFLIHAPADTVRPQIPASAAVVRPRGGGRCELQSGAGSRMDGSIR